MMNKYFQEEVSGWVIMIAALPYYTLEFFFVGLPFYFLQGLIIFAIYSLYLIATNFTESGVSIQGSISFDQIHFYSLLIPIFFSIIVFAIELATKKTIIVYWKYRFWSLTAFDSIVYAIVYYLMSSQGMFSGNQAFVSNSFFLGLYLLTVGITALHFWLKEKVHQKGIDNLKKFAEKYQKR